MDPWMTIVVRVGSRDSGWQGQVVANGEKPSGVWVHVDSEVRGRRAAIVIIPLSDTLPIPPPPFTRPRPSCSAFSLFVVTNIPIDYPPIPYSVLP